ncbi:MAG: peptide transporter, partial [Myxococcales bacterium]
PLSFAVGAYLPLSTTLPIFIGGAIKGIVDRRNGAAPASSGHGGEDVGPGSLFATGLVAGGTLTGTIVAFLHWPDAPGKPSWLDPVEFSGRLTKALGDGGYTILGVICFAIMGIVLYAVARRPMEPG